MAAKPPKPPGNFLSNSENNNSISNNNNSNNINNNNNNENNSDRLPTENANSTPSKKATCNCTNITIMHLFHEMKQEFPTIPDTVVTQCVNENCHQRENCIQMLRNELELNPIPVQSYPAKVLHPPNNNHNSHSHTLHHNSNHNQQQQHSVTSPKPPLQQKPLGLQQKAPLKLPLKPVRPAPLQPPILNAVSGDNSPIVSNPTPPPPVPPPIPTSRSRPTTLDSRRQALKKSASGDIAECLGPINEDINDMPTFNPSSPLPPPVSNSNKPNSPQLPSKGENVARARPTTLNLTTSINSHKKTSSTETLEEGDNVARKSTSPIEQSAQQNLSQMVSNNKIGENGNSVSETTTTTSNEQNIPRVRPTTLNLNSQLQQQQRQLLNVQLQEQFLQQRNRQHSALSQTQANSAASSSSTANNTTSAGVIIKPVRKAPLPPIAPKPVLSHSHTNNINNNYNHSDSLSSSHTNSPLSESEISVNVSLSAPPSPTSSSNTSTSTTSRTHHTTQNLQNKSPIRHRSVITLQPEPPYTRDFLQTTRTPSHLAFGGGTTATESVTLTPTTNTANSSVVSSPTNSGYSGCSQKSYTSVNLTLRPPTTVLNSALQPSAIDITAGPGFSGASGGGKSLSYSSTSYDARLGYQQNFHITVTDEGGVFSASRRRPQQQQRNTNQQQHLQQQQYLQQQLQNLRQQQLQQQQQFHNSRDLHSNKSQKIKSPQGIGSGNFGNMCLAPQQAEDEFVAEILERQKKRRDKLAAALRENKKRLVQVEHEVNLITGPIPMGLAERLDIEIEKLRAECQAMIRSSNPLANQPPPPPPSQQQQQFPPQPFPRQRSSRPPPRPPPPRQTSLDIIQHHTTSNTPHTPASLPNFSNASSPIVAGQQQQFQHSLSLSPSIYQQQQQHQQIPQSSYPTSPYQDQDTYYSDTDNGDYEDDDDDEYELMEPWECSMCTFRNHPQLNICECCENVRILPGTLTNLSRAISNNSASSVTSAAAGAAAAVGLTSVTNRSVTDVNAAAAAASVNGSMNSLTSVTGAANSNLEHDTNLAQQQLQHLALHT
ncbi:TAK1-associated binding protein 2 isoform X2 [Haematobia irritans]|uniref:TAK1-associated binding protein 2 isoform X2 n=1 Tax=Haematobia irritans TaxID=7368 RepID=UPI003F5048EA